jgi:hypothetical protein
MASFGTPLLSLSLALPSLKICHPERSAAEGPADLPTSPLPYSPFSRESRTYVCLSDDHRIASEVNKPAVSHSCFYPTVRRHRDAPCKALRILFTRAYTRHRSKLPPSAQDRRTYTCFVCASTSTPSSISPTPSRPSSPFSQTPPISLASCPTGSAPASTTQPTCPRHRHPSPSPAPKRSTPATARASPSPSAPSPDTPTAFLGTPLSKTSAGYKVSATSNSAAPSAIGATATPCNPIATAPYSTTPSTTNSH